MWRRLLIRPHMHGKLRQERVNADFGAPTSSLRPAGEHGWAQIPGPKLMYSRLAVRQGLPPLEFPNALNIGDWIGPE